MALYLYASGAQRQTISVMSHLGISESYQNLTHKPRTNTKWRTRRVSGDKTPPAPPPSTPKSPTEIYLPPDPNLLAEKMEGLRSIKLSTLRELSSSMRSFTRVVASTGLFAASYDNINMVFRAAEQILGRSGKLAIVL
jgi:hypothetical protein